MPGLRSFARKIRRFTTTNRFACLGLLTGILCAGLCAGQTSGPNTATGSVTGKVVQDPGGQGVRKVLVELTPTDAGETAKQYRTATDALGVFRIEGVEAGTYAVEVSRAGYYAIKKNELEWTVKVEAGKDVSELVYKLQATGVISGKIVDGEGDPVANIPVVATRPGRAAGGPTASGLNAVDARPGVTNDLGEYRIANLLPGKYEVHAEPTPDLTPAPNPVEKGRQREKAVYAKTYYPGTLEEGQAGTVQVISGGTATVNIGLLANRAYRVSGTLSEIGAPQMSQILLVSRGGVTAQESLQEGGKFEFQNVQPGTYDARVILVTGIGEGQRPSMKMEMVRTPIVVDGADVTGLDLVVDAGGTVMGKFRTEDDSQIDWTQITIVLLPVPEPAAGTGAPELEMLAATQGATPLNEDGSFEIKDVPGGTYQLVVAAKSEAYRDYYTMSVTESGREVVDTGFTVTGGAGLAVVVSHKGCSIEGIVTDGDGKPVVNAEVIAVPASGQRMRPDAYQAEKTNVQGQYFLRGMNPGKYMVLALVNPHEDLRSAEFFGKYGSVGEQLELTEGDKKSLPLKVTEVKE
jgi:Carboxypeptidase regulatory-like domain